MPSDMTSRLSKFKTSLPEITSALQSFTQSTSAFRIVRTVNPTNTPPKTLYILDSSFNPPSIAHLALATSAIQSPGPRDEKPHRLLLLFSTHNADKAPTPAAFEQRLAMMILFAEDLSQTLKEHSRDDSNLGDVSIGDISIDVALTTAPYYTAKSEAISNSSPTPYHSSPTHIHLLGFDTLTRFLAPKYYKEHSPPLSALAPFFNAGHRLRATTRPYNPSDPASRAFGTEEEQQEYVTRLSKEDNEGGLGEGWKTEWARQIELVPPAKQTGVSSTRVRTAAKEGDWETIRSLCTDGVAAWIQEEGLYGEDASGKKMA